MEAGFPLSLLITVSHILMLSCADPGRNTLLPDLDYKCYRLSTSRFLLTVITHAVSCTMIHLSIYNPLHLLTTFVMQTNTCELADVALVGRLVYCCREGAANMLNRIGYELMVLIF